MYVKEFLEILMQEAAGSEGCVEQDFFVAFRPRLQRNPRLLKTAMQETVRRNPHRPGRFGFQLDFRIGFRILYRG